MVALKLTPPKNAAAAENAPSTPGHAAASAQQTSSSEENKENLGANAASGVDGSNPGGEVICSQPTPTSGVKSDGDSSARDSSAQQSSSQDVEMAEGS